MIDVEQNKESFINLFKHYVTRDGSAELLDYIKNKTDFFEAPASTKHHLNEAGGLCEHSLNVYENLVTLYKAFESFGYDYSEETLVICGLLHDLCKANTYKIDYRNQKVYSDTGSKQDEKGRFDWQSVPCYVFDEDCPYGNHGGKSVALIFNFMKLHYDEASAIQCHMGNEDGKYTTSAAYQAYPIAWLLHAADEAATFITEAKKENA